MMLLTLFKVIGGSLLAAALIWALVLAWWQSNDHQPDQLELALYLGALPLAVIGGYWLLRGFIEHLKAPPPVAPVQPADDDPLAGPGKKADAAERAFTVDIIDAFVRTGGGRGADEILAAMAEGKRPDPDASLLDNDGFPVFAAAVADLDSDSMAEMLAEKDAPLASLATQPEVLRAMTLLDDVLQQARERLIGLLENAPQSLTTQVLWLVPASWEQAWLVPLRTWLADLDWPEGCRPGLAFSLLQVASESAALKQLDELILSVNRNPEADQLLLVISAVSLIDQQRIDAWSAANLLFSAKHQERLIPGEGGVAILLAAQACCDRLAVAERTRLSRVSLGARDKSVHAGGRITGQLIQQLASGVLDVSGTEPATIMAAVTDTDHRAANAAEMLEGLGADFAHLDPLKDCLGTGTCSGAIPPVGSLVALACAHEKTRSLAAPVICLSNQHDKERGLLLVMPHTPAADSEFCAT
ncbi:MAG: hypothetical protein CVU34_20240 [Betaproteobacteria bacterium HGW-Betaproteobacteria-7]|jgi:hypothetical protein|nr:MAG: hypothetical protein CVU34_20240 [Betaproteobacteria bacterium HGW-Betaproteobacteria-7]